MAKFLNASATSYYLEELINARDIRGSSPVFSVVRPRFFCCRVVVAVSDMD
jgi:hypothetical protein